MLPCANSISQILSLRPPLRCTDLHPSERLTVLQTCAHLGQKCTEPTVHQDHAQVDSPPSRRFLLCPTKLLPHTSRRHQLKAPVRETPTPSTTVRAQTTSSTRLAPLYYRRVRCIPVTRVMKNSGSRKAECVRAAALPFSVRLVRVMTPTFRADNRASVP